MIKIWNLQTGKLEQTIENAEYQRSNSCNGLSCRWTRSVTKSPISDVVVSPDGRIFNTSYYSTDIKVWKLQ